MANDKEEMIHYALAASATVNGAAVLYLMLNFIFRAHHKYKCATATAANLRHKTLSNDTSQTPENVHSTTKWRVTMNNLLATLASHSSKSTTDNRRIAYGEVYTDPVETTAAVVHMPARDTLCDTRRPTEQEEDASPTWLTSGAACARQQTVNETVNPWQYPPPSYSQATRMTGRQSQITDGTCSLMAQTQQRQERTTSCTVDGTTTAPPPITGLRLPVDDSDDKSKHQAQLLIEFLMRVYACVGGTYIIMTSGLLHFLVTTSAPRHQEDCSDVTSLMLLSVYAGLVAYRLTLNVTVRLQTCQRGRGTVFLLVAYDTVLVVTLGLILFGGKLDILGGIIMFSECATLFVKINKSITPLPQTLTSYATTLPLLNYPMSKRYSTAIVNNNSTTSNNQLQSTENKHRKQYTKARRLRTCTDSCKTSTRRHCPAIGEVTVMFICRLIVPAILLFVYSINYSPFSQAQLQLCIFAYSVTFFGAFHIFALIHNLRKLKMHFFHYSASQSVLLT